MTPHSAKEQGGWNALQFLGSPLSLEAIEHVNQLPEPAVIAPVKAKGDSGHIDAIAIGQFLRGRFDALDSLADDDIGEVLVHRLDGRIRGRVLQPDNEEVLNKPAGMEVAIKPGDHFDRLVRVVGNLVKVQVIGGNQLVAQEVLAHVFIPRLPIGAPGAVHQDQRHKLALAGLHQGQEIGRASCRETV